MTSSPKPENEPLLEMTPRTTKVVGAVVLALLGLVTALVGLPTGSVGASDHESSKAMEMRIRDIEKDAVSIKSEIKALGDKTRDLGEEAKYIRSRVDQIYDKVK